MNPQGQVPSHRPQPTPSHRPKQPPSKLISQPTSSTQIQGEYHPPKDYLLIRDRLKKMKKLEKAISEDLKDLNALARVNFNGESTSNSSKARSSKLSRSERKSCRILLDYLNTCTTRCELMKLPEIGEQRADKILKILQDKKQEEKLLEIEDLGKVMPYKVVQKISELPDAKKLFLDAGFH